MNQHIIKHTEAEHIHRFILDRQAAIMPETVSKKANQYLAENFPVQTKITTSIIDWMRVPHVMLKWVEVDDDATSAWSKSTLAGQCPIGILLYNSEEPCLMGEFDFMIRNLDELLWKAVGCRLLFGVNRAGDGDIVFTPGVIEFNGKGELFASI